MFSLLLLIIPSRAVLPLEALGMNEIPNSFHWQDAFSFTCRIKQSISLLIIKERLVFAPRSCPIPFHLSMYLPLPTIAERVSLMLHISPP